jgi:hypothetical protein
LFRLKCTVKSVRKEAGGYRIERSCEERGRLETDTSSYRILSATEYIVTYGDGLSGHFRYCPQADLPEPWRTNVIGELGNGAAAANPSPEFDDAYIAIFWRVDANGVLDVRRNEYVFTSKKLDKASKIDPGKSFAVRQRVSQKEASSGTPLQYERTYARGGRDYFVITQDLPPSEGAPNPVAVLSPTVTDRAGVKVGAFLDRVQGYNWRKLCGFVEGMLECRAPYSNKVTYDLGDESTTGRGPIERMLSRLPVRKILISAY